MNPQQIKALVDGGLTPEQVVQKLASMPSLYNRQDATLANIITKLVEAGNPDAKLIANQVMNGLKTAADQGDIIVQQQFDTLMAGHAVDMGSLALHAALGELATAMPAIADSVSKLLAAFPLTPPALTLEDVNNMLVAEQERLDAEAAAQAAAEAEQAAEQAAEEARQALQISWDALWNIINAKADAATKQALVDQLTTEAENF